MVFSNNLNQLEIRSHFNSKPKSGSSPIWKVILWGRELLEKGTRWRIGNGEAVEMTEAWIPRPTTFKLISPNPNLQHMKVAEFITKDKQWDIGKLRTHLMEIFIEKILEIPLTNLHKKDIKIFGITQKMAIIQ